MNHLTSETSKYLRDAIDQPVNWYPWGKDAFSEAQRQNKPLLLDIGASWCHWCHVMDEETYGDPDVVAILNERFIAIKVDRDERPDVDSRYQAAVHAITGQGGWPLTGFLTPEGKLFYGGTYFPPHDIPGKPGFVKILKTVADTFQAEHAKVLQNAADIEKTLQEQFLKRTTNEQLSDDLIDAALDSISREYDIRYGGFGTKPKFPHPAAIDLLIACHDRLDEDWMIDIVYKTLLAMADGGIWDHLGGGFHRYSVDRRWIVPHFEKMIQDNSALLVNYVHAFQVTDELRFKETALAIVRYLCDTLADRDKGGFYCSQDADVTKGDDGSFYTWSVEQAKKVLTGEEFDVVQLRYDIYKLGELEFDERQNVLFIDRSLDQIAEERGAYRASIETLLAAGMDKMRKARKQRSAPSVDSTIYANYNGMAVNAILECFKLAPDERSITLALKSLSRVLAEHLLPSGLISHRAATISTAAYLDDQLEVVLALLNVSETTGDHHHLPAAEAIMKRTIEHFWDQDNGGFRDTPKDQESLGSASLTYKPVQDLPSHGGNGIAVLALNRLFSLTGDTMYQEYALKTLECFAPDASLQGMYAATLFLGLETFLHPPLHVVIVSLPGDVLGNEMFHTALTTFRANKIVTRIHPDDKAVLPQNLRSMIEAYDKPAAYVCTNFVCAPPARTSAELEDIIRTFGKEHKITHS